MILYRTHILVCRWCRPRQCHMGLVAVTLPENACVLPICAGPPAVTADSI